MYTLLIRSPMKLTGGDAKVADPATETLAIFEELLEHWHASVPISKCLDALFKLAQ